jgi:hypothetical protein
VIEQREPGARGDRAGHRLDQRAGVERQRDGDGGDRRAAGGGEPLELVAARAVRVIGREQVITRGDRDRAERDRHARGRVGDEHQPVGRGADEPREAVARAIELGLPVEDQEPHRRSLEALAPGRGGGDHAAQAAAVGTVVEVDDIGIERPARQGRDRLLQLHAATILRADPEGSAHGELSSRMGRVGARLAA